MGLKKSLIVKFLTANLSLLSSSNVFGIGGVSDGGVFKHGDRGNPWFLENTKQVQYCIHIDEKAMGIDKNRASTIIQESFEEWKEAFSKIGENSKAQEELAPYGRIRLGTQKFFESCEGEVDLVFNLGSMSHKSDFPFDLDEYLGITIRTSYDSINLKGRGLIYIAPDEKILNIDGKEIRRWTYLKNFFFRTIIRHELAHVFGVPHGDGILNARLLESTLTPNFLRANAKLQQGKENYRLEETTWPVDFLIFLLENVGRLHPKGAIEMEQFTLEGCGNDNPIDRQRLFSDTKLDCGKIVSNQEQSVFNVFLGNSMDSLSLYAEQIWDSSKLYSEKAMSIVFLDPNQQVFPNASGNFYKAELYDTDKTIKGKLELTQAANEPGKIYPYIQNSLKSKQEFFIFDESEILEPFRLMQ